MTAPINPVWPALVDLQICVCAQLIEDGLPPLCICEIMPGSAVAFDYLDSCDDSCGMGWIRLAQAFPSTNIPTPSIDLTRCASSLALQVEVGVVRCFNVIHEDGSPAEGQALRDATELQVADMMSMRRAILCCFKRDVILGTYTPLGPQGGALGGIWSLTIGA